MIVPLALAILALQEPRLVAEARPDLERPGKVLFEDGFEDDGSFEKYFEIRGRREGRVAIERSAERVRGGSGSLRLTAVGREGKESSAGVSGWLGNEGVERIYFRRYVFFAPDYDQGKLHHVGGGLCAVAGRNKWEGMGTAGQKPRGDDRFTCSFEPWRDWGRVAAPGRMHLYTYWMDMKGGRDGKAYGNMLEPPPDRRVALERGRWHCLEHMIAANTPGAADGELAAWIDGKLYVHFEGLRWRSSADVRLKRFSLDLYVHQAARDNTVWFDDAALSTGYLGPLPDRP